MGDSKIQTLCIHFLVLCPGSYYIMLCEGLYRLAAWMSHFQRSPKKMHKVTFWTVYLVKSPLYQTISHLKLLVVMRSQLVLLFILLYHSNSFAQFEIVGAETSYEYHPITTRLFANFDLYQRCNGLVNMPDSIFIKVESTSTVCVPPNDTLVFYLTEVEELLTYCLADSSQSSCYQNSSTAPLTGFERYRYSSPLLAVPNCEQWKLSWTHCCRDSFISNIQNPATTGFYLEMLVDHRIDKNFTSDLTFAPTALLANCSVGVDTKIDNSIFAGTYLQAFAKKIYQAAHAEIFYELTPLKSSANTLVTLLPSLTPTNPFINNSSLNLNSQSGLLNLNTSTAQLSSYAIKAFHLNKNGDTLGMVMRDLPVNLLNCNNRPITIDKPVYYDSTYTLWVLGQYLCSNFSQRS